MRAPDAWTLAASRRRSDANRIHQFPATGKRDAYYNGAHNQREAEETYCREPNVGHELSELPRFRAQGVMEFGSRAQASQDHLRLKALTPVTLQPGDCVKTLTPGYSQQRGQPKMFFSSDCGISRMSLPGT